MHHPSPRSYFCTPILWFPLCVNPFLYQRTTAFELRPKGWRHISIPLHTWRWPVKVGTETKGNRERHWWYSIRIKWDLLLANNMVWACLWVVDWPSMCIYIYIYIYIYILVHYHIHKQYILVFTGILGYHCATGFRYLCTRWCHIVS